jgi:hypothetical protein
MSVRDRRGHEWPGKIAYNRKVASGAGCLSSNTPRVGHRIAEIVMIRLLLKVFVVASLLSITWGGYSYYRMRRPQVSTLEDATQHIQGSRKQLVTMKARPPW